MARITNADIERFVSHARRWHESLPDTPTNVDIAIEKWRAIVAHHPEWESMYRTDGAQKKHDAEHETSMNRTVKGPEKIAEMASAV